MTDTMPGPSRTLDVQQFIDERRFSPYQWFVLILCFLIVATDGFDTAAIGFVAPSLAQEWHATKARSFRGGRYLRRSHGYPRTRSIERLKFCRVRPSHPNRWCRPSKPLPFT